MLSDEEQSINLTEATTDKIHLKELAEKNISTDVLRLDKIHPVISGNKWFKLKYYLQEAIGTNHKTILTFGGAYSNHIIAAAYAANASGLKSIGIIRGERSPIISHSLLQAEKYGMQLAFISREDYKKRNEAGFQKMLAEKFDAAFIIPEGGSGANGIRGSAEILNGININAYTHIICAVGTGTMFSGLANSSLSYQKIIGISVLKGMTDGYKTLPDDLNKMSQFEINHDYHFGGYAKKNEVLIEFINGFYRQTGIPTDFVYTGKLFYAALDLVKRNYFNAESKILVIHSGGLQGNASLMRGTLIF